MRRTGRTAFSLVELMVIIGIIMILAGLLLPAVSRSWAQARQVRCMGQLQQIGVAIAAYANDNRGAVIPYAAPAFRPHHLRRWPELLFGQKQPAVVRCPTADSAEWLSYLLNLWIMNMRIDGGNAAGVPPSRIVLAGENWPNVNYEYLMLMPEWSSELAYDPTRHGALLKSNYLWLDFHVSNDPPVPVWPDAPDAWCIP